MKKLVAMLLALCIVLCTLLPVAAAEHTYIYLRPANFENSVGTWTVFSPESGALEGISLKGKTDRSTSSAVCASAQITLPSDGEYYVWVRGMDHDTVPGTRHFQVALGDYLMPGKMGTHGSSGFAWQQAGSAQLSAGKQFVKVIDTSCYFARCDAILVTDDKDFVPPADSAAILAEVKKYQPEPKETSVVDTAVPVGQGNAPTAEAVTDGGQSAQGAGGAAQVKGKELVMNVNQSNFFRYGDWAYSSRGQNGGLYSIKGGSSAIWNPNLAKPVTAKVSFWGIVVNDGEGHNDPQMTFEVYHNGQIDTKEYDSAAFEKDGWVEIGTYDFAGTGEEFVRFAKVSGDGYGSCSRIAEVKLEAVSGDLACLEAAPKEPTIAKPVVQKLPVAAPTAAPGNPNMGKGNPVAPPNFDPKTNLPREGYTLLYADEFDGDALDMTAWHYRNEGTKTRGGYNDPAMVTVGNGDLSIGFQKIGADYHGGGVITNFGLGYGYYEVRSKLFGATGGLHSSFWTAGVGGNGDTAPIFNQSIELDFYEVDSNKTNNIAPNFHYWLGGHYGATKNFVKASDGKTNLFTQVCNADDDYFVCGCEYLPDRVIWYINGQKVCESTDYTMYGRPNLWLTALANTELSGDIDDSKLPGESLWDYFRFYSMPFKGENLVVNPSFDENNRANYMTDISQMKLDHPVSWLETGDESAINVASGDDLVRSGTGVLKIGKAGAYEATAAQELTYIANGSYTFTAYVKNDSGADVKVFVQDQEVTVPQTDGKFYVVNLEDVKVDNAYAYLGVTVKGDGQDVYVDDVSFACNEGIEEYNRKVTVDPFETSKIAGEVAVDNEDAACTLVGEWKRSSVQGYRFGSVYSNSKDASATWNMEVESDGDYRAEVYIVTYANSIKDAQVTLTVNDQQIKQDHIDQTAGDSGWHTFGTYSLKKGDKVKMELLRIATTSEEDGEYARADCARLVSDAGLKGQDAILLKIGERKAFKKFAQRFIDNDNPLVVPYINDDGRTQVPLRFIAEELGAIVDYEQKAGVLGGHDRIMISLNGHTVEFATGVQKFLLDGKEIEMDTAPENRQDRTFVPVRAVSESLGREVSYANGYVSVSAEELTDSELAWLGAYLY